MENIKIDSALKLAQVHSQELLYYVNDVTVPFKHGVCGELTGQADTILVKMGERFHRYYWNPTLYLYVKMEELEGLPDPKFIREVMNVVEVSKKHGVYQELPPQEKPTNKPRPKEDIIIIAKNDYEDTSAIAVLLNIPELNIQKTLQEFFDSVLIEAKSRMSPNPPNLFDKKKARRSWLNAEKARNGWKSIFNAMIRTVMNERAQKLGMINLPAEWEYIANEHLKSLGCAEVAFTEYRLISELLGNRREEPKITVHKYDTEVSCQGNPTTSGDGSSTTSKTNQ